MQNCALTVNLISMQCIAEPVWQVAAVSFHNQRPAWFPVTYSHISVSAVQLQPGRKPDCWDAATSTEKASSLCMKPGQNVSVWIMSIASALNQLRLSAYSVSQ